MWCRTYQAPHWTPGCRSTWYLVLFRYLHPHHNRQRCSLFPFRIRWKGRRNRKFHYMISTLKMIKKNWNYSPTGTKCITSEEKVRIMHCKLNNKWLCWHSYHLTISSRFQESRLLERRMGPSNPSDGEETCDAIWAWLQEEKQRPDEVCRGSFRQQLHHLLSSKWRPVFLWERRGPDLHEIWRQLYLQR